MGMAPALETTRRCIATGLGRLLMGVVGKEGWSVLGGGRPLGNTGGNDCWVFGGGVILVVRLFVTVVVAAAAFGIDAASSVASEGGGGSSSEIDGNIVSSSLFAEEVVVSNGCWDIPLLLVSGEFPPAAPSFASPKVSARGSNEGTFKAAAAPAEPSDDPWNTDPEKGVVVEATGIVGGAAVTNGTG
jgi:hypothetical protein